MDDLRSDVADLMKVLKSEGGSRLEEIRDRVSSAVHDKAQAVKDKAHHVGESIGDGARDVRRAAEEHPFTTATVALCVGLVTGALLRGSRQ